MIFSDHFSGNSKLYSSCRPGYPDDIFSWLAEQAPAKNAAWDCATGTGQAALGLAKHFRRVYATDASVAQIKAAIPAANIQYEVKSAEASGLAAHSMDLVTVAQALHWFDIQRFFDEALRVLVPSGVLAVWTYGVFTADDAAIDEVLQHFYRVEVGPYWPPERQWVDSGYKGIILPTQEIASPQYSMRLSWTMPQLLGYVATWSAVAQYRGRVGVDPVPGLASELEKVWGGEANSARPLRWPLTLRACRA